VSDFAWFKLLVRLVGLLLIGLAGPMVLWYIGRMLTSTIPNSPTRTSYSFRYEIMTALPGILAYGAQLALGMYLFLKGDWVIRKVLAEINGRCSVCGFDLTNVKSGSCPECNTPFKKLELKSSTPEAPSTTP
jgi:hypothetical protein